MNRKAVLGAAAVLGLVITALALFLGLGYRTFSVLSPSMGQTAPVGSLVVTHAAPSYVTGDIIAFHHGQRVYTHRIVGTDGSGFLTKGDLNGASDPWIVESSDIIGQAVWLGGGLGWLLRALPLIVVGFALISLIAGLGRPHRYWRWAIQITGWTFVVAIAALWLRPWVNLEMLTYTPADDTGVIMHVVNTGLFPLNANGTVLASGQDALIHVTEQNAAGHFTLAPTAALSLTERLCLYLVCLIPLLGAFLVRPDAADARAAARPALRRVGSRRHLLATAAIVAAVVVSVGVVNQTMAYAAYTGKIVNSSNTAGSRAFFRCRTAVSSLGAGSTYVAYALGTAQATGTNETDLSGNGRSGRYLATSTTSTSVGCPRDTPARSVTFNGTSQCLYVNANYATTGYAPNTFSLEAWFRTGSKSNGRIIGFGNVRNGAWDATYDRHLYLDKDGRIVFGVYPGAVALVYSGAGTNYADNNWHHVVATLSSAGMFLYVDGDLKMSKTTVTSGEGAHGYWKVGCGNLSGWRNAATDAGGSTALDYNGPSYFTGQIQYAAVYSVALSAAQAKEHYLAGRP